MINGKYPCFAFNEKSYFEGYVGPTFKDDIYYDKKIDNGLNSINSEIKKELTEKLEEFATYNDSLEEVFENKEQIEVSKFYEKLPKPHALAVQEWLDDKIYYRETNK
jgi:hypothetical protein